MEDEILQPLGTKERATLRDLLLQIGRHVESTPGLEPARSGSPTKVAG
jgi:hypothetical protein